MRVNTLNSVLKGLSTFQPLWCRNIGTQCAQKAVDATLVEGLNFPCFRVKTLNR